MKKIKSFLVTTPKMRMQKSDISTLSATGSESLTKAVLEFYIFIENLQVSSAISN